MLKDLLLKNRNYRECDRTGAVTREELINLVERAGLTPSSVNKQALKYYLACEEEKTNQIQPLTTWTRALRREMSYEGHCPRAFIIICQDTAILTTLEACQKDVSIVAQTMLLRAAESGLGGCMIGGFQKNALHEMLKLNENLVPLLVVAIGKPDGTIVLEDIDIQGDTTYYRDTQDVHRVPKRTARELIINGEQRMLRDCQVNDLSQICRTWNAVVAQGNAFSQLEQLGERNGDVFFSSQSKTHVCIDEDTMVGLYILHPNNVGRRGHICNASFAVNQRQRGKHIGKTLVLDCMKATGGLGFRILQSNAAVESSASARHLYESLEFHSLGTIPDGFLQSGGAYVNIIPYYTSLTEQYTDNLSQNSSSYSRSMCTRISYGMV